MSDASGSTILTDGAATAGGDQGAGAGGNPAPVNGAEQAVQDAMNGPPEYIPPKFWDAEKKAPRVEDLGKSYINLEKLLGREKVPLPSGDDDEEGWGRAYSALGRPEKPDDYEFERPSDLPADLPYDDELEKNFRLMAHVNGLNKRQAKNFYDTYVKQQRERHAAYQTHQQQARAQAQAAMQREYGNQYQAKIGKAQAALKKYADPDYFSYLNESGAGNDPRMIRAWIKIGEEMAGDERLKGSAPQAPAVGDLDKAISDFRGRHEKVLMDRSHPDHEMRVREYTSLFEKRYGGDA